MERKPLTFGSLFSGIGGFDLGFERAGMECRWQVEIDSYAAAVLQKHWPDVTRWRDVATFPPQDESAWAVDVIAAGPPCQPVSLAGKRKGSNDERWMWGECLRVVAALSPKVFVAENPTGLLADDRGRTFHAILRALSSVGYDAEWHVIPAAAVGAPHRRDRLFIVAWRDWEPVYTVEDFGYCQCCGDRWCSRCDGHAGECPCLTEGKAQDFELVDREWGTVAYANSERGQVQPGGRLAAFQVPKRSRYWKAEPGVSRVVDGVPNRLDRLRCLGNAVVPQIAEIIGRGIVQAIG
jgi:DNA (cytosine-5)-methyltransferase 1